MGNLGHSLHERAPARALEWYARATAADPLLVRCRACR
jgi:hypothetical protein